MSEAIDITKPVWTKRGGVVTELMETATGFRPLRGVEDFDGDTTVRSWTLDGHWSRPDDPMDLDLTNTPPAGYEPSRPDMVNHPPHYTAGGIECINAIQAMLTPEEWRGFLKGQILKYTWREKHKGGKEDIGKAGFYLDKLKGEA
jgi:hypothetical protein